MHRTEIPDWIVQGVVERQGRQHAFDVIRPESTALCVIDMQNYFLKPGAPGEVPMGREIVPSINRLATTVRSRGGYVFWVKNSTNGTKESWSVFNQMLMKPDRRDKRLQAMSEGEEGHELWAGLDVDHHDQQIVKKRFSAFIQGSSRLHEHLAARNIDTVIIAGVATNVCCESSARDAMMLNYKTIMVSDATATWSDDIHNASLTSFYMMFGDVLSVDQSISALDAGARAKAA